MQLGAEAKIGLGLTLLGIGGAGAIEVAPAHTEIGWGLIAVAAIGFITLASHHFRPNLTRIWNPTHKQKMIVLSGMLACGIGFLAFTGVYFWPTATPATPEMTLKYLYGHDSDKFLTENTDFNVAAKIADKSVDFSFSARMTFDFEHRARWVSYYIPLDLNTFGICI